SRSVLTAWSEISRNPKAHRPLTNFAPEPFFRQYGSLSLRDPRARNIHKLLVPMQVEVNAEYDQHQHAQEHHQKREAEEFANGGRGLALVLADQYNPVESAVVALKAR